MSSIRRSFGLSAASKYTQLLLFLGSNIALARLLTPEQIGLYGIAAVFAGIAQTFRDMGIGSYLVREPELDNAKIRVAFTLMTVASWFLGGVLFLAAVPLAALYDQPSLAWVIQIQCLCFIMVPFGAIGLNLLRRDFRFGAFYFVNVAAAIMHVVTAIGLAYAGFGADSLAWAAVAAMVTTSVGAALAHGGPVVYHPTLKGAKLVMSFGGYVSASRVLGTLNKDIPELLVAKFLGMAPLAFFSKAQLPSTTFSDFVMGALNPVLLPAFSQKHQDNGIESSLRHGVACLTAAVIPPLVLLACLAEWVVMLLFGPQWGPAVVPMQVLALATGVWSLTALLPTVLTAVGQPKALMTGQLVAVPARIGLVAVTLPFGLEAVAIGWLASHLAAAAVWLRQLRRYAGIGADVVIRASAQSVLAGGGVALMIGLIARAAAPEVSVKGALVALTGAGSALVLVWFVFLTRLDHPLYREVVVPLRRFLRAADRGVVE